MRTVVEKFMDRYGTDLVIVGVGGTRTVRGFFQPEKNRVSARKEAMALGEVPRGRYTYLGPVSAEAGEGDTVRLGEKEYLLCRVENYYYGKDPLYQWGLCTEKGGADTWGQ